MRLCRWEAVLCYSLTELFGEKLRALAERCRPRDLYDVVHMHRHPDLIGMSQAVNTVLARKCNHAEIDVPTIETIRTTPFRGEIEAEWENMLGHQLPRPLPPFADFWSTLDDVFGWLAGTFRIVELPRASLGTFRPRLGGAEGHHFVAAWRASRVAPLCRSQPAEGRHRLPSGERAMGITASRAVLAALHPRGQPDSLCSQRLWTTSELPSGSHCRHPSNGCDLSSQSSESSSEFVTRRDRAISTGMFPNSHGPDSLVS